MEEYTAQDGDSLIGISLKFNLNLYSLLRMNSLSEDSLLFPGMRIKLQEKPEEEKKGPLLQKPVAYCSPEGQVEGKLLIFPDHLKFVPSSTNGQSTLSSSNHSQTLPLSELEIILNFTDVSEALLLDNTGLRSREHTYVIQLLIYTTGNEVNSGVPIARIYFKMLTRYTDIHQKNQDLLDSSQEVITKINELLQSVSESSVFLTKVPFPDYLEHNKSETEVKISEEPKPIHELNVNSGILTAVQVQQLGKFLPDIQKFSQCQVIFSCETNGFSLRTLFRQTEERGPCILLVKDSEKCAFGAFLSSSIKVSPQFYGDSDSFVFTFKVPNKITHYPSKTKNGKVICTSFEGIIIGNGKNPALCIAADLFSGYSKESLSFKNKILSSSEIFQIINLEIWGFYN